MNSAAFAEWDCERRRRGGKSKSSWTPAAQAKSAKLLAKYTPAEQQAMVDASIAAGWQGLFPPKSKRDGKTFKEIDAENEEARMKTIREGFIKRHAPQPVIEGEVINAEVDAGAAAWKCYADAYRARYGVEPVRNGKTTSCLTTLVSRLPEEHLAGVIAWYLQHNGAVYVASKHCVELLLRDAEGLHTEWARGEHMTSRRAREMDSLQTTCDAVDAVLKKHPEWNRE